MQATTSFAGSLAMPAFSKAEDYPCLSPSTSCKQMESVKTPVRHGAGPVYLA